MTFTEAAIEILRRAGKPLHFKDIAQEAVNAGLLSHVGQTPDATMGARLLALARREHDRKVVATETGVFALAEWGLLPAAPVLEAPVAEAEPEQPYRTRERHPPLQAGLAVGGRREERRRHDDDEGRRKKRFAPPAEVAWTHLKEAGPLPFDVLAKALREKELIAEALERDTASFRRALEEENRRRKDQGRTPAFDIGDDGTVKALESVREKRPERAREERQKPPVVEARPAFVDEARRQALRQVRRRLAGLDVAALERIAVALLEAQGYRELNLARRSAKDGPLYLARHKWGAGELRYAVRVYRPGRDLGRTEVQELRRDLARYSSQLGVAFSVGECSRDAKGEANAPNTAPVMLYGQEAFAEALVDAGLGVAKRMLEWVEYDDGFFASMGGGEPPAEVLDTAPELPAESAPEPRPRRDRDRDRRPRRPTPDESAPAEESAAPVEESSSAADEPAPMSESAPAEPAAPSEEAPAAPPSDDAPSGESSAG